MHHPIRLHRRGPALWPEVMPESLLRARQREMGSTLFSAVYQGEPAPASGQIFRWEWLLPYDTPPRMVEIGQAWDTALKGGQDHDYSCGITGGRDEDGLIYLLDLWRGQVETPALQRAMLAAAERWQPGWMLVEDAGAGSAVLPLLRARRPLPLIPIRPDLDKRRRALLVTPTVEGGGVRRPSRAPWLDDFRDELLSFPGGKHDDQVDALVYLLTRFATRNPVPLERWSSIKRPHNL